MKFTAPTSEEPGSSSETLRTQRKPFAGIMECWSNEEVVSWARVLVSCHVNHAITSKNSLCLFRCVAKLLGCAGPEVNQFTSYRFAMPAHLSGQYFFWRKI